MGQGEMLTHRRIAKKVSVYPTGSQELRWPFRVVLSGVKGDRPVSLHQPFGFRSTLRVHNIRGGRSPQPRVMPRERGQL